MSRKYRSILAKLRCGVASLIIESGRYDNTPIEKPLCSLCDLNSVEDELHVLLICPVYSCYRDHLYSEANNVLTLE